MSQRGTFPSLSMLAAVGTLVAFRKHWRIRSIKQQIGIFIFGFAALALSGGGKPSDATQVEARSTLGLVNHSLRRRAKQRPDAFFKPREFFPAEPETRRGSR